MQPSLRHQEEDLLDKPAGTGRWDTRRLSFSHSLRSSQSPAFTHEEPKFVSLHVEEITPLEEEPALEIRNQEIREEDQKKAGEISSRSRRRGGSRHRKSHLRGTDPQMEEEEDEEREGRHRNKEGEDETPEGRHRHRGRSPCPEGSPRVIRIPEHLISPVDVEREIEQAMYETPRELRRENRDTRGRRNSQRDIENRRELDEGEYIVTTPKVTRKRRRQRKSERRAERRARSLSEGEREPQQSDEGERENEESRKEESQKEGIPEGVTTGIFSPKGHDEEEEESREEAIEGAGEQGGLTADLAQTAFPEKEAEEAKAFPGTDEGDVPCLVAQSAIIMGFSWIRHARGASVLSYVHGLLDRYVYTSRGQKIHLWKLKENLPAEISDLSAQFRKILGWRGSDTNVPSGAGTWTCHRLELTDEALRDFFPDGRLHTLQDGVEVTYPIDVLNIELALYPIGPALLIYHINYMPESRRERPLTLHEVRSLLYIAKYRYKVKGVFLGYTFTSYEEEDNIDSHVHRNMGEEFYKMRYHGAPMSLGEVGNWVCALPSENLNNLPPRLMNHRHAVLHSCIILSEEPREQILYQYLFHLKHAYGQQNRPAVSTATSMKSVIAVRLNRFIGVSREGVVSLSWPLQPQDRWEVEKWPIRFQGVYLALTSHILGEKLVLNELSELAAEQAENLKVVTEPNPTAIEETKARRNQLRALATLVVRYTLSMSSNDCGGGTEYTEFFVTLRKIQSIPDVREELSSELKDVLAVVESTYLEEERIVRDIEEEERKQRRELQKQLEAAEDQRNRQFEILLSAIGSLVIPFFIVTGVFGMNLTSLPDPGFIEIMLITCALCAVLGIVLQSVRWWIRRSAGLQEKKIIAKFREMHQTLPQTVRRDEEGYQNASIFDHQHKDLSAYLPSSGVSGRSRQEKLRQSARGRDAWKLSSSFPDYSARYGRSSSPLSSSRSPLLAGKDKDASTYYENLPIERESVSSQ